MKLIVDMTKVNYDLLKSTLEEFNLVTDTNMDIKTFTNYVITSGLSSMRNDMHQGNFRNLLKTEVIEYR